MEIFTRFPSLFKAFRLICTYLLFVYVLYIFMKKYHWIIHLLYQIRVNHRPETKRKKPHPPQKWSSKYTHIQFRLLLFSPNSYIIRNPTEKKRLTFIAKSSPTTLNPFHPKTEKRRKSTTWHLKSFCNLLHFSSQPYPPFYTQIYS